MTELSVTLPDELARKAEEAGLLTQQGIEKLIAEALRRRAFDEFLSVADRIEAAGVPMMSLEEINAEIKAYRAERRAR